MSNIYLETNAIRKLNDFECKNKVFTSVFVLFELISGIDSSEQFRIRKANIEKIFNHKIPIIKKMVDQVLGELVGIDKSRYSTDKGEIICLIAQNILKMNSYEEFIKDTISFEHLKPIWYEEKVSVQSWLKQWDNKISDMIHNLPPIFYENKDYIKKIYSRNGVKGLGQYYWGMMEDNKIDESRLGHASAFCSRSDIEQFRKANECMFSTYNFRLFMTAQAIIFAKAVHIDGGTQDRNNPSDLLHLLYLNEEDKLVSDDKIYGIIAEGISDFHYIKIGEKKKLSDLL